MQTGALVLARLDSQRLPGKALADLVGRPMLGRVLDRVARTPGVDAVVVATSDRSVDDPIADFAEADGWPTFRGDAHDVLGRCAAGAAALGWDAVLRASGDSPFFDPAVAGQVVAALARSPGSVDLATNVHPRTFPPGVSAEVIAAGALARLAAEAPAGPDREHVTTWAYAHPDRYAIANVAAPDGRYAGVRLTVDEPDDLARARRLLAGVDRPEELPLDEVVARLNG